MKQNYYEILEVDKNASPEIIKKAYSTLAKKYHPDLQDNDVKHLYEEKLKLINEAYETLSNPDKRALYNEFLDNQKHILENQIDELSKENEILKNQYQTYYKESQNNYTEEEIRKTKQKAYYDAYIQDLKNRGYKIKYKKTPKNYFKNFISLLLTILILLFLWQLPFVRGFILDNILVQSILNIF